MGNTFRQIWCNQSCATSLYNASCIHWICITYRLCIPKFHNIHILQFCGHLSVSQAKRHSSSYPFRILCTVKPVVKTTWEIGTLWELRTAASVPSCIDYVKMDLRNKTTSEFRAVFLSPLGVPNSQVSLHKYISAALHEIDFDNTQLASHKV